LQFFNTLTRIKAIFSVCMVAPWGDEFCCENPNRKKHCQNQELLLQLIDVVLFAYFTTKIILFVIDEGGLFKKTTALITFYQFRRPIQYTRLLKAFKCQIDAIFDNLKN